MRSSPAPWVLVCGGFHQHGGMDRANYALALTLLEQGRTVHIVAHEVAPVLSEHRSVRLHLVHRPLNSTLLGEDALRRKGRQVAQDVTSSHPAARVVVNGGNCDWPDINWVHGVHACWPRCDEGAPLWFRSKSAINNWKARRDEQRAFRVAKLVLANSARTSQDLVSAGVPESRIRVLYLGTEEESRPASDDDKRRARDFFRIPAQAKVIGFVGALGYDRRKGFDLLLTVIRQLPLPDIFVLAAGGGRGIERWHKAVQEAGLSNRVRLLGFTKEVDRVYSASDILVSPVRYEPFGLNVQEAICRGVPAIVTASAGVAELYPPGLREYLLTNPEDTASLAERIARWHSDPEPVRRDFEPLSKKLRARTWARMAEEMISLIESEPPIPDIEKG